MNLVVISKLSVALKATESIKFDVSKFLLSYNCFVNFSGSVGMAPFCVHT